MLTRAIWPSGVSVTYRSLTWGEFREIGSLQGSSAEKALELYKKCVVDGPREDRVPAGIMMWLFNNEFGQNPFTGSFHAISAPLQQTRDAVTGSYLLCAQAMIASVFKIPFDIMDTWDAKTFLTRLSQAEFIAGVPLNPVDPSVPQDKKNSKGRPKKSLTQAQQMAVERHQNDRSNVKGPRGPAQSPVR